MNSQRARRLVLLAASVTLLSQMVYGQFVAYPVVSPSSVRRGDNRPFMWIATKAGTPALPASNPAAAHAPGQTACNSSNACYYNPADIYTAYQTSALFANSNYGQGITIGIVDAYYNSQTLADLIGFSTNYGLPLSTGTPTITCTTAPTVTIVSQNGGTPSAGFNVGWAQETDLDMQWAHAMAPCANLLLVTANSPTSADLLLGVEYAIAHADIVTNSYGGDEVIAYGDNIYSNSQVPVLFSAGDSAAVVEYPCSSPDVTCVGGTNLTTSVYSTRNVESPWDENPSTDSGNGGGGGGCSTIETEPTFQSTPLPGYSSSVCGSSRAVPDIAALADEYSGVQDYWGSNIATPCCSGPPGMYCCIGGTSLATPLTAGILALIDAERVAASKVKLTGNGGTKNLTPLLYNAAAGSLTPTTDYGTLYHFEFYDVTTPTTCPNAPCFNATAGWDRATGLGVLVSPYLANFLVNTVP